VRRVVRDKIGDGRLPGDQTGAVSVTNGTDEICNVCSEAVSLDEVLYRLAHERAGRFVFHAACFAVWRDERNKMTSARAARD
jgi:hypothetical protein